MANKPFVSQDGYSIGDTPVNIILANGDITTTRITLSNDATSTSGAVVLTGDPNPISGNVGVLQIGPPLGFVDTDIVVSMSHSANGYTQVILQNPDPGTVASADFVVNNDRSTGAGIYGDFGINSSNYAGGGAFGIADGVYLLASNATMSVGTLTEHPLNLATNNVTRMTVASISGNITVTGNLAVGNLDMTAKANLGAVGNVAITGGSANYTLETNGSGVLSWVAPVTASSLSGTTLNSSIVTSSLTTVGTLGSLTVTGNISSGNANLGNLAKANFFQGDGGLLSNITATGGTSIVNGTSNVVVVASGNVTTSVAGTANVLVITTTGANILGTLNTGTGNANVGNLGTGGLVVATGNVTGGNLLTAGSVTAETLVSNVAVGTAPFTVTSTTTVANLSVASATTAGTVTAASQGNITSVGTLSSLIVSGNANVGNLNASGQLVSTLAIGTAPLVVTSTTLVANLNVATAGVAGTVTANAQPNITSVGLLSTLTVGNATANTVFGNGTITTAGTGGNISGANVISANTVNVASQLISTVATSTAPLVVNSTTLVPNLYVAHANVAEMLNLTTGTTGNYYFTLASATTGNVAQVGNAAILANLTSGILYATKFSGDGGLLSNLSGGSSIVNGTSNVVVDSGANVRTSVAGNANIIVATGTGANVNGYLTVSGVTTLGAVANVKITGGTSGYVLRTDGAANLTWVAQGGGGGGVTLGAVVAQSLGMAMP